MARRGKLLATKRLSKSLWSSPISANVKLIWCALGCGPGWRLCEYEDGMVGGTVGLADAAPGVFSELLSVVLCSPGRSDASFSLASGAACGQSLRWVLNVDTRPHMGPTSLQASTFQLLITLWVGIC